MFSGQPSKQPSEQLAKAKLFSVDAENYDIEFMYNPAQLEFSRSMKLNQPAGARNTKGQTKVSFANPEPCVLTISKILFDTYEESADVFKKCIFPLIRAVKFLDGGKGAGPNMAGSRTKLPSLRRSQNNQNSQNQRPPIYYFVWGSQNYLRCFVESFKYQITMFLPDGTPVRATASLTLKEVDEPTSSPDQRVAKLPPRNDDTREKRLGG